MLLSDECVYFVLEMFTSRMTITRINGQRLHPIIKGLGIVLSHLAQYALVTQYRTTLNRGIQLSRKAESVLIVAFSIGEAMVDAEHITQAT